MPARRDGPARVFLLSPANCAGERMGLLLRPRATSEVAQRLRAPGGALLGEVFQFASGLYFRGKRSYANRFGRPPPGTPPSLVIVPGRGLVDSETTISEADLRSMATVPVDVREPRYREPLEWDAHALAARLGPGGEVVLLGSIASGKYVDVLLAIFGTRLLFPAEFVGRGDLSRGGLLLRCVAAGSELAYVPIAGAVRHGPRAPRLDPRTRPGRGTGGPPGRE